MKKYNVGIIGYGGGATAHIPAINALAASKETPYQLRRCATHKIMFAADKSAVTGKTVKPTFSTTTSEFAHRDR